MPFPPETRKLLFDLLGIFQDMLDPAYLAVHQADLDTMGVGRRTGKQFLHESPGEPAGTLFFFQYNIDLQAGLEVFAFTAVH